MPATSPSLDPGRAAPVARTPSRSARSDKRSAATATPAADTQRPPQPRRRPRSSRGARAGDCGQRPAELGHQRSERFDQHPGPADDHQRRARRRGIAAGPVGFAQATASTIPLHSVLELSAHCEPCARRPDRLAPQHDERGPVNASASLEKRLKIGAGGQPLASGKATR